jgi:hypothetical protein
MIFLYEEINNFFNKISLSRFPPVTQLCLTRYLLYFSLKYVKLMRNNMNDISGKQHHIKWNWELMDKTWHEFKTENLRCWIPQSFVALIWDGCTYTVYRPGDLRWMHVYRAFFLPHSRRYVPDINSHQMLDQRFSQPKAWKRPHLTSQIII